jgi:hypothetical protein
LRSLEIWLFDNILLVVRMVTTVERDDGRRITRKERRCD